MPLYEYLCPTCDHKFEKLQAMSATGADCPNCEQPAKRAISVFASVTKGGASEMPTSMSPLPPLGGGGGGCCGGGCGCGP
ncbi:MAG: zinc ribbon domain-containing protein [Dehalococcoidia bacterium]|jgi:putative FmdB family regulatory protein|nr:zinc ribbon domain-containing protein [Dehalococcoidia bacterium]